MVKEIKIIIDEFFFEDCEHPKANGVAFSDENKIIVKEPRPNIIVHELVHILEADPKTREAIEILFGEYYKQTPYDILEEIDTEELLSDYDKEDWISETYAYFLEDPILNEYDNPAEAIDFFCWCVEDITGVYPLLVFETTDICNINLKY
jgi:hypothetical protein